MNIRDLEYFVAVAELGHFHAAAHKCFVSQPTLSGQLRKLEEELGHALLERDTRNVRLTAFGREAYTLAKALLESAESLLRKAKEQQDPFRGPVRIGAFPTLAPWLFPRVVERFHSKFPHTEFFLVEEKSPVLQQQLLDGNIDTAFLALPQTLSHIQVEPLFAESFLLAIPSGHAWRRRKSVQSEDLKGLELLLLEDGHCLRDQALDLCVKYGARERGHFRASGMETLRQMVRLGTGITLIPRLAVPEYKESGIQYLPIQNPEPTRSIALCYRETHPRIPFLQAICAEIRQMCEDALPVKALH